MDICGECNEPIPASVAQCPHCGRPSRFPNVIAANEPAEQVALDARLQNAKNDLEKRGAGVKAGEFSNSVETAEAVINRYFGEGLIEREEDLLLAA
jgi:predicted ATP-dependent serine protease